MRLGPCGPRRGLRVQSGVSPEPWRLLSGGRTSPLCFFSSPSSLPSSQGVPVRPAGRAGLPVRTPQGHPQKFQAGETSPHLFPPKQPGQGSQRDPPSPPACLAGVKLSAGTRRPKAWTVLFDGLTSHPTSSLPRSLTSAAVKPCSLLPTHLHHTQLYKFLLSGHDHYVCCFGTAVLG